MFGRRIVHCFQPWDIQDKGSIKRRECNDTGHTLIWESVELFSMYRFAFILGSCVTLIRTGDTRLWQTFGRRFWHVVARPPRLHATQPMRARCVRVDALGVPRRVCLNLAYKTRAESRATTAPNFGCAIRPARKFSATVRELFRAWFPDASGRFMPMLDRSKLRSGDVELGPTINRLPWFSSDRSREMGARMFIVRKKDDVRGTSRYKDYLKALVQNPGKPRFWKFCYSCSEQSGILEKCEKNSTSRVSLENGLARFLHWRSGFVRESDRL